ncbi:putative periplasmic lipoprotein [Marinobacter confluentis]|uniref:hypothetical protein n=1 Tax=Marinobacter confluentis TaxID=1697557 RepID=UPI001785934D|nr:hypothetical protein [Marinobacter confluentis]
MKYLMMMLVAFALVGCSAQPRTIVSQDPGDTVVGDRPEGYPRTVVKALPDQPGFCVEVTESWKEGQQNGDTVWTKQKTVESTACTKTRWERLSMGKY